MQGYRVEVSPNAEQRAAMGRHAGLSRVVENFCLDKIRAAFAQRAAEQTYGVPTAQLTKAPWTAVEMERLGGPNMPEWRRGSPSPGCRAGCRRKRVACARPG